MLINVNTAANRRGRERLSDEWRRRFAMGSRDLRTCLSPSRSASANRLLGGTPARSDVR
jgi:hypothetical protein